MITPNNFKEIRITPNEDNTLKIDFYGVVFKDSNGKELDPAIVTYPRVKMHSTTFDMFGTNKQIEIEILPDNKNKELEIIYIPEKEYKEEL